MESKMELENKRLAELRQIMRNTRPDSPMYQDSFREMKEILSRTPNAAWTVGK